MNFQVRNVQLAVPFKRVYSYLSDMTNLPEWTHAFSEADEDGKARMRTPEGEVLVQLEDNADPRNGVIDTKIMFPDGGTAMAYSRLIALDETSCAYSFLLTPPPVALERIEGVLQDQAQILEEELLTLKALLEG